MSFRRKESHKRLAKKDININEYKALITKVINGLALKRGPWVYSHKESLEQEAVFGLIKAYKSYDPTRGTFVTIAYLKIHTEMVRFLNKRSKDFVHMNNLEDIKFGGSSSGGTHTWQDLFANNSIDYMAVAKLAIESDDTVMWELFKCLCNGIPWKKVPECIGFSKEDTDKLREELKESMVAVVRELTGDKENY